VESWGACGLCHDHIETCRDARATSDKSVEVASSAARQVGEEKDYSEHPPTCLHYSLEWWAVVNRKEILRDIELDLALCPGADWRTVAATGRFQAMIQKELTAWCCRFKSDQSTAPALSVYTRI
jgi:hypothetical protein